MRTTKMRSKLSLLFIALAAMIAVPAVAALADNLIINNLGTNGQTTIDAGKSTTMNYTLQQTGGGNDGQNGCNAADGTPAKVTINAPAGVTASPSSFELSNCSAVQGVTFTSSTAGTYNITASVSDARLNGGSYDTSKAAFTLTVNKTDTKAPELSLPEDITEEATSSSGAPVTYTVTATDDTDTSVTPSCAPASGSTFPLGMTVVQCSATDDAGNEAAGQFNVTVRDTTGPAISGMPADITEEADSPDGATASWTAPTASDLVDGSITPTCLPASDSTFALGTTKVTCSATDKAGNSASKSFNVLVQDTTAPSITVPAAITAEATGPSGAAVSFSNDVSANDIVDGAITPSCLPASGSTFTLGTTKVTCSATDKAGNSASKSFNVLVQDTTAPALSLPGNLTEEATGPSGAAVNYNASASDLVDGNVAVNCSPQSGSTFPLGSTTVNCSTEDAAGNDASGSFSVTVQDKTAPVIASHADVSATATSKNGAVVTYTSPTTTDAVDGNGSASCLPASGSTFPVGPTTVTCTAKDAAGNNAISTSFKVNVAYDWSNFLQPINTTGTQSVFKLGSTVPVKFNLKGESAGITDGTFYLKYVYTGSGDGAGETEAVATTTGTTGTQFRYDATSGQYIFNWSTKSVTKPGNYEVRVYTDSAGTNLLGKVSIELKK